jgi:hypothetical protein
MTSPLDGRTKLTAYVSDDMTTVNDDQGNVLVRITWVGAPNSATGRQTVHAVADDGSQWHCSAKPGAWCTLIRKGWRG